MAHEIAFRGPCQERQETQKARHRPNLEGNAALPPVFPGVPALGQVVSVPTPPRIAREAKAEPAQGGDGHGLEQPEGRAAHVVDDGPPGAVQPQENKEQVPGASACPRQGADLRLEREADGLLEDDAGPRQQEEDQGLPAPRPGQRGDASRGVEDARLGKGYETDDGPGGAHAGAEVALPDEPQGRGGEARAEGLVPPAAPEAAEPPVEDLVEGAEGGWVVPQLAADAQEGAQHGAAEDLVEPEDHVEGGQQAESAHAGAVCLQHGLGQAIQEGRKRAPRRVRPEDEIGIHGHGDGAEVQRDVAGQHGGKSCAEEAAVRRIAFEPRAGG